MLRFLCAALIAFAATSLGAGAHAASLSPDKRITSIPAGTGHFRPDATSAFAATTPIYGNVGTKYPKGEYFCCYGLTVSGVSSPVGAQYFLAVGFTPATTIKFAGIKAGIGYVAGTNAVRLSVYSDAGGVPGTELFGMNKANLPTFGSCCAVAALSTGSGPTLTAGTPYWVVVSTPSSSTWLAWNYNSTDQVDTQPLAVNSGSGWTPSGSLPGVAVSVFGE